MPNKIENECNYITVKKYLDDLLLKEGKNSV